jgi:hypothetical protein
MPCLVVRDLLPEFALDILSPGLAQDVEEHLRSCPGCRKEAEGFRDGAARTAALLPVVEPDPALGDRVARTVWAARASATAGRKGRPRRTIRIVAAAGLAAAILAGGSFSWALAMRGQVEVQRKALDQRNQTVQKVGRLTAQLQAEVAKLLKLNSSLSKIPATTEGTKVFTGQLASPSANGGQGQVLVVSIPGPKPDLGASFVHLQVNLPPDAKAPFRVLFDQAKGDPIKVGVLVKTKNGDYVLARDPRYFPDNDLSHLISVVVLDRSGETLLTGSIQLITVPSG